MSFGRFLTNSLDLSSHFISLFDFDDVGQKSKDNFVLHFLFDICVFHVEFCLDKLLILIIYFNLVEPSSIVRVE